MAELRLQATTRQQPAGTMDVSVVIVNYNVREFLQQALRSVYLAADRMNVEVIVVDNDSADGSVDMVRQSFPDVTLIANDQNVGFSRANNQGIRVARGRHLLILNPDTILQEDTLETLVRFLDEHPDAGAVGCKILNPDGTFAPESRRAFPTPRVAFYRIIGLSRMFPMSPVFGRYNMTFLPVDEPAEVDALSGSCMMVRRDALIYAREAWPEEDDRAPLPGLDTIDGGAGLFDEDFFMYGEDLDWCFRIQQAGWKIYYTPSTRIIHYKGESTKKGEMRYVRLFYGAMLKFAEKHLHTRYSWIMKAAIRAAIFGRAALSVASRALRSAGRPVIDALIIFTLVSALGWLLVGHGDGVPPPLFFGAVAAGFAILGSSFIGLFGGYKTDRVRRLRDVWKGLASAMIILAALSFFIKDIAFSRLLLILSLVSSGFVISLVRLAMRGTNTHQSDRALLVGNRSSALRLLSLLSTRPDPPFSLVGYVATDPEETPNGIALPYLGPARQLRDIVRLRGVDEVVFSAACLSNQDLFHLMQQLQSLPVQFKILSDGSDFVIGKSSIDDLSTAPLVDARLAVREPRGRLARRAFEIPVAIAGLIALPFIAILSLSGLMHARALLNRLRQLPGVISGSRTLVGYDDSLGFTPPREWDLRPGVFAITDSARVPRSEPDLNRAYWFYVQNQSASVDWDIIWGSLRASGQG